MNKTFALSLALVAAQSAAATSTLEVSLFYPQEYETDASLNLPVEIVGFYRSIELGNALFARDGVDLVVKPTSIQATNEWGASETISNGISLINYNTSVDAATDVGDVAVGLFQSDSVGLAVVHSVSATDYIYWPNRTEKMAMGASYMMGRDSSDGFQYMFAHELFHTMGGEHDKAGAEQWSENGTYRSDGHGVTCASGVNSLLHAYGAYTPFADVTISGSPTCQDNSGDNVAFVNHYAPMAAQYAPTDINDQTLTMSATENLNSRSFDITVTRHDATLAETMKLYVAGGHATAADNHLNTIDVTFAQGETESQVVALSFDDVYPIFNQANDHVNSVYAVAVGENEISGSTLDIMALATDWTAPVDVPDVPDAPVDSGSSSGGSGGGSMPLWGLFVLTGLAVFRKITQ
ncbi:GlyGly-CTERM sorting domain-containing protein [Vibrio cyclitrophicus]